MVETGFEARTSSVETNVETRAGSKEMGVSGRAKEDGGGAPIYDVKV